MPHTIDLSSLAYLASTQPQSSAYPYQSHSHSATPDRAGTSTTGYSHAPYQFQPHLVPEDFNYQSPFSSAYNHASSSTASQRDIAPVQELNITGWSGVDGMEVAERTGPDPFQPWERPAVSLVTGDRFQQLLEAKLNLDSQLPQQSLAFPSQPPVFPIPQPFATPSNIPQRLNQRALDTALYDPSQVHIPPDLVAPLPPQFAWQDRSLTRDISETASPRQSRGWTAPQHDTPFMANSSAPMPNDFSIDVYPNLLPPQAPLHNPLPMPDAYLQPLAMISSSSASSLPSPKLKASPLGFPWPPTTAAQQPQHSYPLPADPLPPPLKIRVHESPVYDVESSRPTLNPVEQKDPSSVVPETLGAWGVGTFPTNMYTSGDVSWSTAAFPIDPALMDPPPPPLPTLADVWESKLENEKPQEQSKKRKKALDKVERERDRDDKKVVIACNMCRARKLKCDGNRPKCQQCKRRGEVVCDYTSVLRRRGPGKKNKDGKTKDGESSTPERRLAESEGAPGNGLGYVDFEQGHGGIGLGSRFEMSTARGG